MENEEITPKSVYDKLIVDRSAFDRIQHAGGFVSVNTSGNTQDANAIPIPKAEKLKLDVGTVKNALEFLEQKGFVTSKSGIYSIEQLKAFQGLQLINNSGYDAPFKIESFNVTATIDGFMEEYLIRRHKPSGKDK